MIRKAKTACRVLGGALLVAAGWAAGGSAPRVSTNGLVASVVIVTAGAVWVAGRQRRARVSAGTATWWDIWRTSSRWAMRRRARVLRPSLTGAPWWQLLREPILSYATPLCRVGLRTIHTSCEESTLRIGIPGMGKTAEMVCRVIDAPGGVLVTSTATDLYEMTAALRAERGPIAIFNPGGIGNVPSTLRWSPLSDCADPAVAARRADDLIGPGNGSAEGERWEAQAKRVLSVLLHAGALGGYRMRDVARWIGDPTGGRAQIIDALMESPQAAEMCMAADHAINTNARTRDGVFLPIAAALAWVTQPAAAAAGDPDPGAVDLFDVTELTDRSGTLYLLGDDGGTVAPLVAALVAEVAHQSRHLAATRPGGRLDPALTFVLDEVALVCVVPLDRWMAELRKRNVVVHAACQGIGQLRQRWGDNGAAMILNSAAAVLLYGGCKDAADLALFSSLADDRDETIESRDPDGGITKSVRRVPVVSVATLAGLREFRALLVRRGMPVALVRTPIGWKRRDVRRAGKYVPPVAALSDRPAHVPAQSATRA